MDDTIHSLSNWDQAKVYEVYAFVAPKCYSSRPFPTFLYKYVWATVVKAAKYPHQSWTFLLNENAKHSESSYLMSYLIVFCFVFFFSAGNMSKLLQHSLDPTEEVCLQYCHYWLNLTRVYLQWTFLVGLGLWGGAVRWRSQYNSGSI